MHNTYTIFGPNLSRFQDCSVMFDKEPTRGYAELRGEDMDVVCRGTIEDIKHCYRTQGLFSSMGGVYRYFLMVDDDSSIRELEVQPDATWLTLGMSGNLTNQQAQVEAHNFNRLMSPMDEADNYALVPVKWRGIERRMICEVLTPPGQEMLPEDQQQMIFRPLYLAIDPQMMTQLEAHHPDMSRSDTSAERTPPKDDGTVKSDVIDLSAHRTKH